MYTSGLQQYSFNLEICKSIYKMGKLFKSYDADHKYTFSCIVAIKQNLVTRNPDEEL